MGPMMQPIANLTTPEPPAGFGDSLRRIISAAVVTLQGDAGLLVLRRGGVELERVSHGLGLVDLEPTARLLKTQVPKLATNGAGERHFARLRGSGGRFRFVLALPVRLVHEIEGTLCIFRSGTARAFVTADQESLSGFAGQIAIAIENAW